MRHKALNTHSKPKLTSSLFRTSESARKVAKTMAYLPSHWTTPRSSQNRGLVNKIYPANLDVPHLDLSVLEVQTILVVADHSLVLRFKINCCTIHCFYPAFQGLI